MWNKLTKEQKLKYVKKSTQLNLASLILIVFWFVFLILCRVVTDTGTAVCVGFVIAISLTIFGIQIAAIVYASYTRGVAGEPSVPEQLFAFTLIAFFLLPLIMTILSLVWCKKLTKMANEEEANSTYTNYNYNEQL